MLPWPVIWGMMRIRTRPLLAAAGLLLIAGILEAQTPPNVTLNYKDPSQRTSRRSERESDKKKAAATPVAGAPAKPGAAPDAKGKPGFTQVKAPATTGTAANRAAAKGPAKPGAQGGAGAGQVGQLKEFTKEMAESLRPRKVDFDPEEMADKPGVILLNPRKLQ
jgi:hypothetical protein